jgi:hypothetical protein
MPRDFFDPTPEEQKVFLVNAATVSEAENLIKSCEQCNPEMEIRFAALPILLHGSRNMYPSKAPCSMGRSPALTKLGRIRLHFCFSSSGGESSTLIGGVR